MQPPSTSVARVQIPEANSQVVSLLLILALVLRGFSSRIPDFLSPHKPTLSNFNFNEEWHTKSYCVDVLPLLTYYFYIHVLYF